MQSVRTVVPTLIAVFLATAGAVLAAPAVRAHAQGIQQSSRTDAASSHRLTIAIDGVSPDFATPASTVTVRGTLTNHTGSAIAGLIVQLLTSPSPFSTRSGMDSFAASGNYFNLLVQGTPYTASGALAEGATVHWTVSFSPAQAQYSVFGVYPLEVEASSAASSYLATDHTFLPFWPDNGRPRPLNTAWVWPLIDQPQQGACDQTLATNSLAGSLSPGGRLAALLAAGVQWTRQDHLTWAIDPALLSDANVMTRRYKVGGCTGAARLPPSAAAGAWLSSLRTGTAGEEMFLTPYADADVSALAHAGLDANLKAAYQLGESVAEKILPGTFGKNGAGGGGDRPAPVAWPADGTADASVLTSLASDGGISTVILSSGELPSTDGRYDNALGKVTTGIGSTMRVLLADSRLTAILGSASAASPTAAQFDAEQDFLAQTAMIAAEAPSVQRSLVIAPPRRWDPSAAEAAKLLSLTHEAPWLREVGLSSLAAAAGQLKVRESLPGKQISGAELGDRYLDQVSAADAGVALYKDLLYQPGAGLLASLDAAVAATTSAAWRTDPAGGEQALARLTDYLSDAEQKVTIIAGKKVLLGGASGYTPVSVTNLGQQAVQVKVLATPIGNALSVGNSGQLLTVQARKTGTVRIQLHSTAIGTTLVQLQLATKDGSPLTWKGATESLSVQATRYGQALLVLIGAALGVLVLTSVARWIRQWLNDGKGESRPGGTG
jgi:hypothetical protein